MGYGSRVKATAENEDLVVHVHPLKYFDPHRCWETACLGFQEFDDMKMIRDYFSYEHFYVIYCGELG